MGGSSLLQEQAINLCNTKDENQSHSYDTLLPLKHNTLSFIKETNTPS